MNTKLRVALLLLVIVLGTGRVLAVNSTVAQGGNITWLRIEMSNQTDHWQGLAGQVVYTTASAPPDVNATGSQVNATVLNFTSSCPNPTSATGFIIFKNSSALPTALVPGNLSLLDQLTGSGTDRGSLTFTANTTFALSTGSVAGVPTAYMFVNQQTQGSSFREGYFNQGADIAFATVVEQDLAGYNQSSFDFQALLVAPNRTTIPYFIFADITFTCPSGVAAFGGGGGRGACSPIWRCNHWGPCQTNGFQERSCELQTACGGSVAPPSRRQCGQPGPQEERPEVIAEQDILSQEFVDNLLLELLPSKGVILEPAQLIGVFTNKNAQSLEGVTYEMTVPSVYATFESPHHGRMLGWTLPFGGWTDHGPAEARVMDWAVTLPEPRERLDPLASESYAFTLTPPLMLPATVEIGVDARSGPVRVKSVRAPLTVDVRPFQVAAEWRAGQDVLILYYVVDNRGRKEKSINIEVDLNQGRSTLISELLGPLRVPEDQAVLYGHEYRLSPAAQGKKLSIYARVYAPDSVQRAQTVVETR